MFVTQEAEVKPKTEKTFDTGIIIYAKRNLLWYKIWMIITTRTSVRKKWKYKKHRKT